MSVADALRKGETNLTLWSVFYGAQAMELFARSDADSVVLDAQHGTFDVSGLVESIGICKAAGKPVLVRVPLGRHDLASRVLDFGADGVISPMVNSAAEARAVVDAAKYPPIGNRSWGPARDLVLTQTSDPVIYFKSANADTLALVMVETREAVEYLDEILAVDGLDGVFVGPADLSISWTAGDRLDPLTDELQEVIRAIADKLADAGKVGGIYASSIEDIERYHDMGYRFLTCSSDAFLLQSGIGSAVATARDRLSSAR